MAIEPRSIPPFLGGGRSVFLARLIANGLAQAGITYVIARLVKFTFDSVIHHPASDPYVMLSWVGAGLLASALCLAWLRRTEFADGERMGQDYVNEVRMHLFDCLRNAAVRSLQRRSRGAMLLRFVGDLNSMRRWVSLGLARLVVGGVTVVAATVALAFLNWTLALPAGMILAVGLGILLMQGRYMREAVIEARRWRSRIAANINEKIASLAVMQVFGRSDRERERVARQSNHLREAMVRQAGVTGQLRGIGEATTAVAAGPVLIVGAVEVSGGHETAGTVVAAMGIVRLLTPALHNLARVYEYWQSALIARQKMQDFLNAPLFVEELPAAMDLVPGAGRLDFRDVSVAGSLKHFSATVLPGQRVAVVGPNGSGKSSLLMAAARLVTMTSGKILLDGQDLAVHTLASVRRTISMLGPDLPLMRGTIKDNICYRWPDASEEELAQVIRQCGIDEILHEFPEGLKARVSDGGSNLSPGHRQRIALARAILGNPAVLLLDEADENLDPRASLVLDRILTDYPGTVIVVTHRRSRAASANLLWHLEGGNLVEIGSPQDILRGDGPSARLFQVQLSVVS